MPPVNKTRATLPPPSCHLFGRWLRAWRAPVGSSPRRKPPRNRQRCPATTSPRRRWPFNFDNNDAAGHKDFTTNDKAKTEIELRAVPLSRTLSHQRGGRFQTFNRPAGTHDPPRTTSARIPATTRTHLSATRAACACAHPRRTLRPHRTLAFAPIPTRPTPPVAPRAHQFRSACTLCIAPSLAFAQPAHTAASRAATHPFLAQRAYTAAHTAPHSSLRLLTQQCPEARLISYQSSRSACSHSSEPLIPPPACSHSSALRRDTSSFGHTTHPPRTAALGAPY